MMLTSTLLCRGNRTPAECAGGATGLRHWLIAGFRYAAQAAAMREGHLWDIERAT
jgi:hypothetical protein